MTNMSKSNKLQWIPAGYLLLSTAMCSCTNEIIFDPTPSGEAIPLKIEAGIELREGTSSATTEAANAYDRTTFIEGDVITVRKEYGNQSPITANYTLKNGVWTAPEDKKVTLQAGAKYQARYPSNYDAIKTDQSTANGYLQSNLLETPKVSSPQDENLSFTGENAFKHVNSKLSLVLQSSNADATLNSDNLQSLQISGTGIAGSTGTDYVTPFRPDGTGFMWCCILSPKTASTSIITVSLTYYGVTYNSTISCTLAADTHYTYTLTLKDDELISTGSEIKGWTDVPAKTGELKEVTTP